MSYQRMLPFLLLNILVSAAVMLAILWWWDRRVPEPDSAAPVISQEINQEIPPPERENAPEVAESPEEDSVSETST